MSTISPFVLDVLKFVFLALLYFFVYRAVKSVTADYRSRRRTAREPAGGRPDAPGPPAPKPSRKAKLPRKLVVTDGDGARAGSFILDGNLQIGRAEDCQIRVGDTYVSQVHARVFRRDGAWYVEDMGSTNGTYLNQQRVTSPAELRAGDRVQIGKTVLEART